MPFRNMSLVATLELKFEMPDKSGDKFSFAPVRVGSVWSLPSIASPGSNNVPSSFDTLAVSGRCLAQAGPETPSFGPGSKNGAASTESQPRTPRLMLCGDIFLVSFKGPRGPSKGPRGPSKGPRGPLKGPRGPVKGPRGPFKGPPGSFQRTPQEDCLLGCGRKIAGKPGREAPAQNARNPPYRVGSCRAEGSSCFPSRRFVSVRMSGYLKGVWLEMFGRSFPGFSAETDPRDTPGSPGPAPHISLHEKSAPRTNSKTKW